MRARNGLALLSLLSLALPSSGQALTFQFVSEFDTGAFGNPGGSLRGITTFGSELIVSDAEDDQLFRTTTGGALQGASPTQPFNCPVPPGSCLPAQENAGVIWDVAYDETDLWVVDRPITGGSTTWLIQLNAAGEFLARSDVSFQSSLPGGLEFDPRGAGSLLLTDALDDRAYRYDLAGVYTGQSYSLSASGNPRGITHISGDRFLVSDLTDDKVYEFDLPAGAGAPTFIGETSFIGIDIATVGEITSADYDPISQTLYLTDNQSDRVLSFVLVPEPGTASLFSLGLVLLAGRRRTTRAARVGAAPVGADRRA